MTTLKPFDRACPLNDEFIVSERYAENLHRALVNEISTEAGAHDFLRTTYPTKSMLEAARLIFDRLNTGQTSNSPGIYRFHSQYGGGKTHTLIALAAMAKYPRAVRETDFANISLPKGVNLIPVWRR